MIVLGSTGSIGVNTLDIAKRFGLEVEVLVSNNNTALLNKQIKEHNPRYVVIGNAEKKDAVEFEKSRLFTGSEGIVHVLHEAKSETVVNALVGYSGVMPSITTQRLGKKLALANKESLVVAGKFLDCARIHPIDSEHFGLWYLQNDKAVQKLYITASGGALRDWEIARMENATVEEVLEHPNWDMGAKITVDSASMVNKLFELLEARWLFGKTEIDAFIERKSIVHALVEFVDGSTTAHMAGVDMRLPIAYALQTRVEEPILTPVDPLQMGSVRFEKICTTRYPVWKLKEHLLRDPDMGVVVNAANDLLVKRFLEKKIGFGQIAAGIERAVEHFEGTVAKDIEQLGGLHREVSAFLTP